MTMMIVTQDLPSLIKTAKLTEKREAAAVLLRPEEQNLRESDKRLEKYIIMYPPINKIKCKDINIHS